VTFRIMEFGFYCEAIGAELQNLNLTLWLTLTFNLLYWKLTF